MTSNVWEMQIISIPFDSSGGVFGRREKKSRVCVVLAHYYIKFVVCELDWELGIGIYGIDGDGECK